MVLFGCAQNFTLFRSYYARWRLKGLGACNIYERNLSCPLVAMFFEVAVFVKRSPSNYFCQIVLILTIVVEMFKDSYRYILETDYNHGGHDDLGNGELMVRNRVCWF